MAIHHHKNQALLNVVGQEDDRQPFELAGAGETADLRRWSRAGGLADGVGNAIDPGDTGGVAFSLVRASALGMIFARSITLDRAGTVVAVGPETAIVKTSLALFEPVAGGIAGRKAAKVGDQDDFFQRTTKGLQARDDFTPESETAYMRATDDGRDVELKPED